MQICGRGILNPGAPGSNRAVATFPSITALSDGTVLVTYRVGSTKDSDDETIEIRRSKDGGRSWSNPVRPFSSIAAGRRGSLKVAYVTQMEGSHLVAAALWVDREAFPGKPLFNEETEGCLPMAVLLAHSWDLGQTWTFWRPAPIPDEIGPPSLTNPLLRLASGRWALSIETNKEYLDKSQWLQRVVYLYTEDEGQSWSEPLTVSQDPSGRIFNWDQRAGIARDGRLVTFSWTYDRTSNVYLNIHRRLSADEGKTWSEPEDLGFADQASHPAILPDGRLVLAWVDRFKTRTIRARCASAIDAPFDNATEVVLYEHPSLSAQTQAADTGEMLAEMGLWSFGLPFLEALPNGEVLAVYYAGSLGCMDVCWTRLSL
jgi:BNR repeat protein